MNTSIPLLCGIGMTSLRTRRRLVRRLRRRGIDNEAVLKVIENTPRHLFVDEALASRAYEDIALPIGFGQTLSQPYIVARMTEALLASGGLRKVLEIGTGSAYQAAVLSPLVNHVYSIERIVKLLERAKERLQLLGLHNVYLKHGDGRLGWPENAPYDGIMMTAAPQGIPASLLEQLRVGGRLIAPVGMAGAQELVLVERNALGFEKRTLGPVSFVPLLGGVL